MTPDQRALLTIAVMAAHSDKGQNEAERAAIAGFESGQDPALSAIIQSVTSGQAKLSDATASLLTSEQKQRAFEVAAAVCNADGASNAAETAFLESLRTALALGPTASAVQRDATDIANVPVTGTPGSSKLTATEIDKLIFDAAVLNGALELLPDTLASMAILPLQAKLVYRIGQAHNYDLGREHIRDFVATLGVGMTAQYLEGFARKLLGGLLGGVGRQAASSGMAFVSTWAIGQAAKRYYAGGRRLEALQMKETYQSMMIEGKSLLLKAQNEIQARVGTIRSGNLADLIRSS